MEDVSKIVVLLHRKAIPLGENEGVYVRDVQTGQVSGLDVITYPLTRAHALVTLH